MKNGKKLLLLSALILVGCGGGGNSSESSSINSEEPVSSENSSVVSESESSEAPVNSENSSVVSENESSEVPVVKKSTVTDVINASNGYIRDEQFVGFNKGDEYEAGETVNVSITISYTIDEESAQRYIVQVNDTLYRPSSVDDYDDSYSVLRFSVVVPEEDMKVYLVVNEVLETSEDGYKVTLVDSPYAKVLGYDVNGKYNATFRAMLWWDPGFSPESLQYRAVGTEEWTDMNLYFYNNVATIYGLDLSIIKADVELKLFGEYVGAYNITYVNADKVSPGRYADPFPTVAQPGSNVSFSIEGANGYYSNEAPTITGINPETATVSSSYVSFIMPENDVTIEFHVAEQPTITFAESDTYVSAKAADGSNPNYANELTSAEPGDTVYVFIETAPGYALSGIKVNGGETIPSTTNDYSGVTYCQFTMPEGDAVISVETVAAKVVTVESSGGGTLTTSSSSYAPGSTVRLDIAADDKFHGVGSVAIKDHSDIELTFFETYSGGYYTFVMPDYDVTVVVEFVELDSTLIKFVFDDTNVDSFGLQGTESYTYADLNGKEGKYLDGERATVFIEMIDLSTEPTRLVFKDAQGNEVDSYDYYYESSYGTFGDITIPEGYGELTLSIEFKENEPLSYSIEDGGLTGYELLYKTGGWNAPFVEDLGTVYPNTSFQMQINGEAGEGYQFNVYVTDTEGNVIESQYGTYYITTDFVIHVEKVAIVTMTFAGLAECGMNTEYTGLNDSEWKYYHSGDEVASGTALNGYWYSETTNFKVEVIDAEGKILYTFYAELDYGEYAAEVSFVAPEGNFTVSVVAVTDEPSPFKLNGTYSYNDITCTLEDGTGTLSNGMSFTYEEVGGGIEVTSFEDPGYAYDIDYIDVLEDGSLEFHMIYDYMEEYVWTFVVSE